MTNPEENAPSTLDEAFPWMRADDGSDAAGSADELEAIQGEVSPGAAGASEEGTFATSYLERIAARDRGEVNLTTALGSNPVTDDERALLRALTRRNRAARRQAAEDEIMEAPVAHRDSDIVPMRQWKAAARKAGMPTSPDTPSWGVALQQGSRQTGQPAAATAGGHSVRENFRRPFAAMAKGARKGAAFLKGRMHGKEDGGSDVKVGPSYKSTPSGRRDPARPEAEGAPGKALNMTHRGHIEDYTI